MAALSLAQALPGWTAGPPKVIEAEKFLAKGAERYRDSRASGKKSAGAMLDERSKAIVDANVRLPAGDYLATFWVEAQPIEILHKLELRVRAGTSGWGLGQINFAAQPGYQPFGLRFFHAGGKLRIQVWGRGGSGFQGIRKDLTEAEKAEFAKGPEAPDLFGEEGGDADDDDIMAELEGERNVARFKVYEQRLLCDRIEVKLLRPAPVTVTGVEVDKVHYLPGETVKAQARVFSSRSGGEYQFRAEDVTGVSRARQVFSRNLTLSPKKVETVKFEFKLDKREFGHELRCSLLQKGKVVHSGSKYFGVSKKVYRIGITANSGPQNTRVVTPEYGAKLMQANKANYANYFERFAWAPCDYSNLAPKTEEFSSGQTQYPGSITGMGNLIREAHKVGIKAITYGKACGAGIEGFKTFQRHPDIFHWRPEGTASEAVSVFYLERMLVNDYNLFSKPIDGGWQHWASLWTKFDLEETVTLGAQSVIDGVEMFGWDGIRWDGHFVSYQKQFIEMLNRKYPNFEHGYNIAFANPGSKLFLPPAGSVEDFNLAAANHGLMMDESVRDWSRWSRGADPIRAFYEGICNEADYIKRVGGLPLFITFDTASTQDQTINVICGLAAGQRYTYMLSPGDFPFGPLPKFLTRYSAFIWDDTKMVAKPDEHISIKVGKGPKGAAPWWRKSTWLRELPDGRQQLLINLVNPPVYRTFLHRVQTPPATLFQLSINVKTPAKGKLVRAMHISPDLAEGLALLTPVKQAAGFKVILPRLRNWSIVAFEYERAAKPAFPLTSPVKDAMAVLKTQAEAQAKKDAARRAKAGIGPSKVKKAPYYRDYAKTYNVDSALIKKLKKLKNPKLKRNGRLDVHHARGVFSWFNPVESAVALTGGGTYTPSWVDLVGFKLRGNGCLDGFPKSYDELRTYDVVAVDNVHVWHLGGQNRVWLLEFVKNGGGLLIFGGYYNLSLGADHNTSLAELEPVRITKFKNILRNDQGMPLQVVKKKFFGNMVNWARPASAFVVETSDLKPGVEVLASVGGKPGIVAHKYGKGRVVTVLFNPHGDYPETVRPYWKWSQWPRIIAACVRWLGHGAEKKDAGPRVARKLDESKPLPDELMMEAIELESKEFTAQLKAARVNMIDAENARILLETAVDNADKIEDMDILRDIANRAAPYVDKSFGPLGKKLTDSGLDFLRQAGYQIIGMAGDRQYLEVLNRGLAEKRPEVVRETLIAIGRMGAASLASPIRKYLKRGSEKLLAVTVLKRLGDRTVLAKILPLYEEKLVRKVRLKCGRKSLEDTLWGGVSFKLLPAQRRRLMNDRRTLLRTQQEVNFDLAYTIERVSQLDPKELETFVEYLVKASNPALASLAYAIYARLPKKQAARFRRKIKDAKIEALRFLAE